ncbi:flagellar filament capping protein FliD [Ferrimonas aestuarii]|uniref:Flagellar hook-associated protein 2 n=1 Tax=Ferrimonas aestuarii TaxID=2569539 RepID=A0A4U1BMR6_9GAMM|nr:flagellar filament capping protein FliD [Ferrimonas aestuarii]TKB54590.1 flagellar hook protein FliD [Ferrimonas aestuarii]
MISGMSASQMAQQLVSVERAAKDGYYANKKTNYTAQKDAYDLLEKSLKEMTKDLESLDKDAFNAKSGSISDEDIAKVNVGADAPAGDYTLVVDQLAKASQLSASFAGEDAPLPTSGILEIEANGETMTIDFSVVNASGDGKVSGLVSYINNNSGDTGVQASLLRKGDGSVELMLTSKETGTANEIKVTQDDSGFGFTTMVAAQDAKFSLNGVSITSSTNYVENVIDGISLELTEAHAAGESSTITVGSDTESTSKAVNDFVDTFNTLMSQLSSLTQSMGSTLEDDSSDSDSEDSEDDKKSETKKISEDQIGILKGDTSIRMLKSRLQQEVFQPSANGMRLSDIGIELDRSGKLTVDDKKLEEALKSNSSAVEAMFTGDTGYIKRMDNIVDPYSEREGYIDQKQKNIGNNIERLEEDISRYDRQMTKTYERYLAQFTAMEQYVTSMQSTAGLFY